MLVGDVAPHHHALAIGTQHPVDAIDVLVVGRRLSDRINVCLGMALSEALGLVAVDVEIGRLIGSGYLAKMVFKELIGLFLGWVEAPFRVGQIAVKWIAQNLLKMPKTLLVSNDLDIVRPAKLLQLLDFLGGEGIDGRNVGMTFGLESVLGVERERIELALSHLWDETFQIIHADDGPTTDIVLPSANLEVGPVGDGHARDDDFAFVLQKGITVKLFQALGGIEESRVGGGFQADEILGNGQPIRLVLVFAHAEVVGLDEFDVMLAFDGTA